MTCLQMLLRRAAPNAGIRRAITVRVAFHSEFRRDTIRLWSVLLRPSCQLPGIYLIVTMLIGAGFSQVVASNTWGVNSAVGRRHSGALTIQRFGSRVTMLSLSAVGLLGGDGWTTLDPDRTLIDRNVRVTGLSGHGADHHVRIGGTRLSHGNS
jgi:hypothetical protein